MTKALKMIACISGFTILWLCAGAAYSQSSENYKLEWTIVDEGGAVRDSATYLAAYSIGQPFGGLASSNSRYDNTSGVYAGRMRTMPIPPFPSPAPLIPTVPEPTTLLLVVAGLFGLLFFKRRRNRKVKRWFFLLVMLAVLWCVTQPVSARMIEFLDSGQSMGNSQSIAIALGDLDGDGGLDAFFVDLGSNSVWFYNAAKFTYIDSGQRLGNANSNDVVLGDVDGDGDLDAFVVNEGTPNIVWLNNGAGQFRVGWQSPDSTNSFGIALGDLDGDGDLDAFCCDSGPNTVWKNNGAGVFTDSGQRLGSSTSNDIALGDVDGDGDMDAFVSNTGAGNTVWLNDGSGTFTDTNQSLGSANSVDIELSDLDRDGDLDAFVSNYFFQPNAVWFNDGSGNFTKSFQSLGKANSYGMNLGDVDHDGDLDAFVANAGQDVLWLNDGKGFFVNGGLQLGNGNSQEIALADIDGDNDLDAFIVNFAQGNTVWYNYSELILTIRPDDLPGDLISFFTANNIQYEPLFDLTRGDQLLKKTLGISRTYLLMPTASTDIQALRQLLNARADVETCIYNEALYFDYMPQDRYLYDELDDVLWNLDAIRLPEHWSRLDATPESSDVALAVIDTPIESQHPDLTIQGRRNCMNAVCETIDGKESCTCALDSQPDAQTSHGTLVAGIIGAAHNNTGIAGVAGNYPILAISAGAEVFATFDAIFRAIEYATDEKVEGNYAAVAINLSASAQFTDAATTQVLHSWIQYAYQQGVPIITSMGNNGDGISRFPAAFPETIAVGAADAQNARWIESTGETITGGSNSGPHIDLVAPGVDILSTVPRGMGEKFVVDHDYDYAEGTSMAVPHVSGAMGLMFDSLLTNHPNETCTSETIEELRWILRETAQDRCGNDIIFGWDQYYGSGLLNVAQALAAIETGDHITVKPASYDFENVSIDAPVVREFMIENPCACSLTIDLTELKVVQTGIDPSLPQSGEFRIDRRQLPPAPVLHVEAGMSWTFPVVFAPSTQGEKRAKLVIPVSFFSCSSNNPVNTALTVPLIGTGVDPIPLEPAMLTVQQGGNGSGEIEINGMSCGNEPCMISFDPGASIRLSAHPAAGSIFSGWFGDEHSSEHELLITMDSDKTISATFDSETPPTYTLTLSKTGNAGGTLFVNGNECGETWSHSYNAGELVTLTAEAGQNARFAGWSAPECAQASECTVTIEADRTIVAAFEPIPVYTLRVGKSGEGSGVLTLNGSECGTECTKTFEQGTEVRLSAVPDEHSVFAGWSGIACEGQSECTFTIDKNLTITAAFIPKRYELAVTKAGAGTGIVKSDSAGIVCGVDCAEMYDAGSTVTLTAVPDEQSIFTGWSAAECGSSAECVITMDMQRSVTATFEPVPKKYTLDVIKDGEGGGLVQGDGIVCGNECSQTYNAGTEIRLSALADPDSDFSGWSGACQGRGDCIVAMEAAKTVTATFIPRTYILEIIKTGTGSGSVQGGGISCGETCKHTYLVGSSFTLTAEADQGSAFDNWSIAECGTQSACPITMEKDMTITVIFNLSGSPSPQPTPVSPVPEPGTLTLIVTGLLGLLALGRFGRKYKK